MFRIWFHNIIKIHKLYLIVLLLNHKLYIYPTPLHNQNMTQGQFLSRAEFSFSLTGCHIKVEEPSLLYYLPISKRENIWIQTYQCFVKCKQPHPWFELGSPSPFLSTVTITTWAPVYHFSKIIFNYILEVGNRSRGWPAGSLFNSYYTKV